MNTNKLRNIGIFFTLLVFLSSCASSYQDHYLREHRTLSIRTSSSGVELTHRAILPDKGELIYLTRTLREAQKRIWIEIYTWTEKDTLQAIIDAHKRGVDVRVILEGNVYQTPRINDHTFHTLQDAGIPVFFSQAKNISFTHAKFWIVDDTWCLSTGNWSYSTFTKNREFFACSRDHHILQDIEEIFHADETGEKPLFSLGLDARVGLSPDNMRDWITSHLYSAKKTLYIYNQTVTDPGIIETLKDLYKSGIDVKLCTTNTDHSGVTLPFPVSRLSSPYIHAKLILIDGTSLLLGSINFTTNALDHNRELALYIEKDEKFYSQVENLFFRECFPD